ncbi:protein shisa-4-like isoform X2 [Eleutherodactylus coqui]|uniref:Shisa N-terminal domain-containing protein n=1 Tax=Eleutherodactylus coqui TaxID=57060 RepID=A0A8J6EJA0_ELECQ|nr:hypothetical protein GDO78_018166 [Eleutherodactylus coqui]
MYKMDGTTLIAALGIMCVPVVFGNDCAPYVGSDLALHAGQTCIFSFCAGTCTQRYCSIIPGTQLDQAQFMCILTNLYFVIGCGLVISLIVVASIIACCCKSLCMCFGSSQPRPMAVTNVIRHQPMVQIPYSPPSAGYIPVANPSAYPVQCPPPYPGADNLAFEDRP